MELPPSLVKSSGKPRQPTGLSEIYWFSGVKERQQEGSTVLLKKKKKAANSHWSKTKVV